MTSPSPRPWWSQVWLRALALVLVTFVAYAPSWQGEPVFDDEDHLTPPELSDLAGLARIWTEVGVVSQYYPVTHSFWWLQNRLWGHHMLGYHLVNLFLHAGCALLLVALLRRLQVPGAWLAGALFALHPVHVESVAWISELKNTLSGFFYLAAAWAYLGFDSSRKRQWYVIGLLLFVAALLSKSVTATLPAALLVVFWWQRGRLSWRSDVVPLLPFFLLGLGFGLFTAWVERHHIGADGAHFDLTWLDRGLIASHAVWFYAGKLLWPAELIFIYPRWDLASWGWQHVLVPLGTAALLFAAWHHRHRTRAPLAGLLLFIGTLFPALGFVDVYPFVYSYVADHYQYLASIVILAAVASLLTWGWRRYASHLAVPAAAAGLALLVVPAVLTWRQSRQYTDVETLWQTTLSRHPDCWVAHHNLATHYLERDELAPAIEHGQRALALQPRFAEIHNHLGNAFRTLGQAEQAAAYYEAALTLRPDLAPAHFNLGVLALEQSRAADAEAHFARAVELRPEFVAARTNLASLLLEQDQPLAALQHLQIAAQFRPDDPEVNNNLGNALLALEQIEDALPHYAQVLRQDPTHAGARLNLATAYQRLRDSDAALGELLVLVRQHPNFLPGRRALGQVLLERGQLDDAILHFQLSLRVRADDPDILNDLANALIEKGRVDEACLYYRKALALRPEYEIAHYNLAYALMQRARWSEAAGHLRQAVTLQPRFLQAHFLLGHSLLELASVDEAITHLQQALALDPDVPEIYAALQEAVRRQSL